MFDDRGLNQRQQEAVRHTGSPLLVVAGAGTGKTRTLAARVARILADGADPQRVLLLTFTRRAAAEMLARVDAGGRVVPVADGATGSLRVASST